MPERDIALYVRDMLDFCDRALRYADGHSLAALLADPMRYDAILRNIELIGEAATHVTDEVRSLAPEVSWRGIIGTRNRVAHGYLGIEPDTVWLLLTRHVPKLRDQLQALLSKLT